MWTRKLSNYALASFAVVLFQGTLSDGEALTGCGGDPPACSCSYRSAFDLCVTCCGDVGQPVCPSGGACKDGLHYDANTLHCEVPCSWGTSLVGTCCGDTDQPRCLVGSGYDSCKPGLVEGIGNCRVARVAGESCGPDYPCKDGTGCTLTVVGSGLGYQCVLDEGTDVVGDPDVCKAFYSSDLAAGAKSADLTLNFGWGANGTIGVAATIEEGVFYTQKDQFGCYITNCYGFESNVGASAYVVAGQTLNYDDFKGHSFQFNELAGIEFVSFVTSQGWNSKDDFEAGDAPVSTSQAVDVGLDIVPISVGASECDTVTQLVIGEETKTAPVAKCKDVSVVTDSTCVSPADVNDGSYGTTSGATITTSQSPAGPYGVGITPVTLTVTDSNGLTATCTASVSVRDLTPPAITCPASFSVPNAPGRCAAEVELPAPTAVDACAAIAATWTVPPSGTTLPVGANTVWGMAKDAHDNAAACQFTATVLDAEAPTLMAPPDQRVDATGPDGAVVTYDPFQAADNCAVSAVTSDPASGSTFPINPVGETTMVTGVATDGAGNTTTASFSVHVKGAAEQLGDLLALVETLPHHEGLEHQVLHALKAAEGGWTRKACQALWAVTEEISERDEQACVPHGREALLAPVSRIRAVLACPSREECGEDDDPDGLAWAP